MRFWKAVDSSGRLLEHRHVYPRSSGQPAEERTVRLALIPVVAFGWILGLAEPVAADKPDRVVIAPDGFDVPAGFGCSFAVSATPDARARQTFTTFTDGRFQTVGHANPTFTNVDTGATYVQRSRYQAIETYDPVTNVIVAELSGRVFFVFFPGDVGPDGLVGPHGQIVGFVGHIRATYDPDTFAITSFEHIGTSTDICAEISN
jgi:hypothetical protein